MIWLLILNDITTITAWVNALKNEKSTRQASAFFVL